MVSVQNKFAGFAGKYPDGQRHLLDVAAMRASHRRVTWIHLLNLTASVHSFAYQDRKEGRPRNIRDYTGKTGILDHPAHIQILDGDRIESINQALCRLVMKVFPGIRNCLVSAGNLLPGFGSIAAASFLAAQSPLKLLEVRAGVVQMAGILDCLACAERGKTLDANVNAHALACSGQRLWLGNLADQQDVPARRAARDAKLDASPFNWAAQPDAASAHAGNGQLVAFERAGSLRFILLRKRAVAVTPLESWEACLACAFRAPLEESFERFVNALKRITLNRSQVRFHVGQRTGVGQMAGLLDKPKTKASHPVTLDPLLQGGIVDLPRMLKLGFARSNKDCVGAQFILKRFVSRGILGCSRLRVTLHRNALWLGQAGSSQPSCLTALSIPQSHAIKTTIRNGTLVARETSEVRSPAPAFAIRGGGSFAAPTGQALSKESGTLIGSP